MPGLAQTIARLTRMREQFPRMVEQTGTASHLTELHGFGSNPGALRALTYVPAALPDAPALVVVLHGCTQNAGGYDLGAGWSQMADRHGFVLLFPEQTRQNNANLCFNWFAREDSRRDGGEALSIRQMIAAVVDERAIDPAKIFVTGLSAGGAMTSVMLATYPEIFAGGAIIAGLPYGAANSVPEAFERMRGRGLGGEAELAALVRGASSHDGAWPTISIWHGSGDATVNPVNARAIVDQWRSLHQVAAGPGRIETVDGYPRQVWRNAVGIDVIEEYSITGMGHGTPLASGGADGCGRSGAYMLEASISSTRHICRFWGLADDADRDMARLPVPALAGVEEVAAGAEAPRPSAAPRPSGGVAKIIDDALRAAGLIR